MPCLVVQITIGSPATGIETSLAVEEHAFVAYLAQAGMLRASFQLLGALPEHGFHVIGRSRPISQAREHALESVCGTDQILIGTQRVIGTVAVGIVRSKLGTFGQLPDVHARARGQLAHALQLGLIEFECYGSPHTIAVAVVLDECVHALAYAGPITIDAILLIAGMIPSIYAPVDFITMIQHPSQIYPPCWCTMAAVGYDDQMHGRIDGFDPFADAQKIAAVDGISIVAAEGDFLDLGDGISTNLFLEKIQGQLPIQKAVSHFGPGTSGTAQGTDARRFDVPMIPH